MLRGMKVIDNKGNKGTVKAVISGIELNVTVELEDGTLTAYNESELTEVKENNAVEDFKASLDLYGAGAIFGKYTKKYTHRYMASGSGTTKGKKGLEAFINKYPGARLFENRGNKVVELDVQQFMEKGWMVEK